MRHTKNETTTQTLTRLVNALDKHHPITMTYLKEEKDDAGKKTGRLVETTRTIEIYDIVTTKAGDVLIKAMDRETGEARSWRLDRIVSYTTHRTAYVIERPAPAATTTRRPVPGIATVAAPNAALLTPAARVQLLAASLAA